MVRATVETGDLYAQNNESTTPANYCTLCQLKMTKLQLHCISHCLNITYDVLLNLVVSYSQNFNCMLRE